MIKVRVDNFTGYININRHESIGENDMARRTKKITPSLLKKMIFQEAAKLKETLEQGKENSEKVDAEEVEAGEYATNIEKDIDYLKVLKIHEGILKEKLSKVFKAKKVIRNRISKKI